MIEIPQPGAKVHYKPAHGGHENGIVKRVSDNQSTVFVVYKCDNQWHRYEDFTAVATDIADLESGWK